MGIHLRLGGDEWGIIFTWDSFQPSTPAAAHTQTNKHKHIERTHYPRQSLRSLGGDNKVKISLRFSSAQQQQQQQQINEIKFLKKFKSLPSSGSTRE